MMEDILQQALSRMDCAGIDFCDARYQRIRDLNIRSLNGSLREMSDRGMSGISIRARSGGGWGFASITSLDRDAVMVGADRAVRNALAARQGGPMLEPSSVRRSLRANAKVHPDSIPLEEKVATILELDSAQSRDGVINRVASYVEEVRENVLLNSFGSEIRWEEVRTRLRAMSIASDGQRLERYYDGPDASAGFETVRGTDIVSLGERTAEEAVRSLKSIKAPSGMTTVISDPMVTGLLAHEVMGHASEADEVVKKRSFLSGLVGKKVGSELVTLVDDGSLNGAHGYIPFDDEGTPSSRTVVIDKGIYRNFLHNMETAAQMDVPVTGNGRCENFSRRNWVRMTNTFIEAGDWSLQDMIADVHDGILCEKMINGMEDPVGGGFEAKVLRGYRIRDGRIAEMVRSFTLTGRALEILGTVDAVGDDLRHDGGYCGKGIEDWVPVSSGGPHLRSRMIVGGG